MATLSQDPRAFLERAGLIPTRRGPVATLDPGLHPIHSLPLDPPLPAAELVASPLSSPPTDGRTTPWPVPPASS